MISPNSLNRTEPNPPAQRAGRYSKPPNTNSLRPPPPSLAPVVICILVRWLSSPHDIISLLASALVSSCPSCPLLKLPCRVASPSLYSHAPLLLILRSPLSILASVQRFGSSLRFVLCFDRSGSSVLTKSFTMAVAVWVWSDRAQTWLLVDDYRDIPMAFNEWDWIYSARYQRLHCRSVLITGRDAPQLRRL